MVKQMRQTMTNLRSSVPAVARRAMAWLLVVSCGALAARDAAAQTIGIQGEKFVVDPGDGRGPQPKFLMFISYFDAMRAANLEEDLDYIKSLRFDGIRIFTMWHVLPPTGTCNNAPSDTLIDSQGNVRGDTTPPSGRLASL